MYFWNIEKLSQEVKDGTFNQNEKLKHFVAVMILLTLAGAVPGSEEPGMSGIGQLVHMLVVVLITMMGIFYSYGENVDKNAFIERYMVLSLPLVIRMAVFALPIAMLIVLVTKQLNLEASSKTLLKYLFQFAYHLFFYWRMGYWLNRISKPQAPSNAEAPST